VSLMPLPPMIAARTLPASILWSVPPNIALLLASAPCPAVCAMLFSEKLKLVIPDAKRNLLPVVRPRPPAHEFIPVARVAPPVAIDVPPDAIVDTPAENEAVPDAVVCQPVAME